MAARESEEMKIARHLIIGGLKVTDAATQAGITREAIYGSPWYKAHVIAKQQRVKNALAGLHTLNEGVRLSAAYRDMLTEGIAVLEELTK